MKRKHRLKNAIKKAGKGFKHLAGNVLKAYETAGLAVLLPFKPLMVSALNKKGVPVSRKDKIGKIAVLFHDKVVANKQHLEYSHYEHLGEEIAFSAGKQIVQAVIDFIQRLKDKKERGETLTPDESNILAHSDKVETVIDKATTEAETNKAKNWFVEFWWVWVLIIAALILMYVNKGKKK